MTDPKATNITWHNQAITPEKKAALHGHKGATLWFTGLSGSGKSTLANAVATALHERNVSTFVLDGDNIRYGLSKNLGFSTEDRIENIRRVGEVAKLFTDCAVVNMAAFISPFRSDREIARNLQPDSFVEVYCLADVSVCESRDPKGLYKKARAGEISGFTGIDAPYEAPESPEVTVDTGANDLSVSVEQVISYLEYRGIIPPAG
ncbi:MAG: adenylyl-sulfate kinase [Deltaproteobacteria bacterium]|nr:adenylyl-sulfate kinase [Deltaproteobacteria bacterium]MBN2670921.1 adenylyl-sulfate kinase [Deltaproteobacteria bacterium]